MITFDNITATLLQNSTSQSIPYTMGVGTNSILIVELQYYYNPSAAQQSSGMSFNGIAMSLLDHETINTPAGNILHLENWYLLSPPSGGHTIVATFINSPAPGLGFFAESYFGVSQSPPSSPHVNSIVGTSMTDADTTTASGAYIVSYYGASGAVGTPVFTAGTGIQRITLGTNPAQSWAVSAIDNGPLIPKGAYTTVANVDRSSLMAFQGIVLYPFSGGSSANIFMGVNF